MKNRYRAAAVAAALAVAAVLAALHLAGLTVPRQATPPDTWEFVIEAEARSPSGEILATRQARASTCEPAGSVLLVDDDDNDPDVRSYYTETLDILGMAYIMWDTGNGDSEPDAATLSRYPVVIWFTGDEFGGAAGPGAEGEAALASFLDGGGCLLVSSQDYYWDRGLTPFMSAHLGVVSASSDVTQTVVAGAGGVFGGLGPYSLDYPFNNWSDRVSPDGTAELAFGGDKGDAAVNKDGGIYRATFWGFPLEALPTEGRLETMSAFLAWCGTGCRIAWDWKGESLPADAEEWVKAYFLDRGHTIPVVMLPEWYGVDPALCEARLTCDGETVIVEPSGECLAALRERGLEPDERGFWRGGAISGGLGSEYAFFEPVDMLAEWYDVCPLPEPTPTEGPPQPTYTPRPTYTPEPTPTCRPTWTPPAGPTPLPTATDEPTSTPWPPQPPWGE